MVTFAPLREAFTPIARRFESRVTIGAMAYRRSSDEGVFSSRWRIAHRSELLNCGVPFEITGDDRRWSYLLLHGDDPETGWKASVLSAQQAEELLALLQPHFPDSTGIWLIKALQRRSIGTDRP